MVAVEQVSLGSLSPSLSLVRRICLGFSAEATSHRRPPSRLATLQRPQSDRATTSSSSTNEREQPCAANQPRGRLTTRVWVRTQMQAGPPLNPATDSSPPTARPHLVVYYYPPAPQQALQPFFLFAAAAAWCR